jgi:hypothetical protein
MISLGMSLLSIISVLELDAGRQLLLHFAPAVRDPRDLTMG